MRRIHYNSADVIDANVAWREGPGEEWYNRYFVSRTADETRLRRGLNEQYGSVIDTARRKIWPEGDDVIGQIESQSADVVGMSHMISLTCTPLEDDDDDKHYKLDPNGRSAEWLTSQIVTSSEAARRKVKKYHESTPETLSNRHLSW